jgi:formylglycine-generating enzyme required for sulfatase activity/tRNA A-37 threonylcarbamoyl transferase component Bud32
MFCPQCRYDNPDDAKFCVECGYDFSRVRAQMPRKFGRTLVGTPGTPTAGAMVEVSTDGLPEGSIFAGRYEILGGGRAGSMGVVYRVMDTVLKKQMALKVIYPRLLSNPVALERFNSEVAISQDLNHPSIVRLYDVDDANGIRYITMEWVDGRTLRELIEERKADGGAYPLREAIALLAQVMDALSYAHRYTVHRNIKPENIIVCGGPSPIAKVTDFGIANILTMEQFATTSRTTNYMAPEQMSFAGTVDARADVYSMGVILYEMVMGEVPTGKFAPPSEQGLGLPKAFDDVIHKTLTLKADDRYKDMEEFILSLKDLSSKLDPLETESSREEKEKRKADETEKKRAKEEARRREQEAVSKAEAEKKAADEKARKEAEEKKLAAETEAGKKAEADAAEREKRFEGEQKAGASGKKGLWTGAAVVMVIIGVIAFSGNRQAKPRNDVPTPAATTNAPTLDPHAGKVQFRGSWVSPDEMEATLKREAESRAEAKLKEEHEAKPKAEQKPEQNTATTASKDIQNPKDGYELVYIPAGEFMMGSPDKEGDSNEHPRHKVYLDGYYIGKYEVTNAQFKRFIDSTGYVTDAERKGEGYGLMSKDGSELGWVEGLDWRSPRYPGDSIDKMMDYPVTQISWNDAKAYADWAGLRLPTEAQWEKAARGGTNTRYWWVGGASHDYANCYGTGGKDQWDKTCPVGSFPANGYGLYDTAGNVCEWCSDWYGKAYYGKNYVRNPKGPSQAESRVVRGGSWLNSPASMRSACRIKRTPGYSSVDIGFRCAR